MEAQIDSQSAVERQSAVDSLYEDMKQQILATAKRLRTRTEEYDENKDYGDDAEVVTDYDDQRHVLRDVPRRHQRETVYVAVDELSRHYGGPEEGGWWYDTGEIVDYAPVLVLYHKGEPYITSEELKFVQSLAYKWFHEEGAFGESNRNSMAPRGRDLCIRATYEVPKDWSDYAPYC